MKVDICIPAYNEANVIEETVTTLLRHFDTRDDVEWKITVSDNGSTDGTAEIVSAIADSRVRLHRASKKGKGIAIREGLRDSDADVLGFVDADLSTHPESILDLLREIDSGEEIVVGSRLKDESKVNRSKIRGLFSKAFRRLSNLVLRMPKVEDVQCGAKLFSGRGKEILLKTEESTWFLDVESLALAEAHGIRVTEVPVQWEEEYYKGRKSKLSVVKDGFSFLRALKRIRKRINREKKDEKRGI